MMAARTKAQTQAQQVIDYNLRYGIELGKTIMLYEESLSLQQQAIALDSSGKWRNALGVLAKVEEVKRRAFNGKDGDSHIPQILHNIGVAYATQGEHQKAIDAYKSSLDCQRKLTGDKHPGVASGLTNLANAFLNLDPPRLNYAQQLYEKALDIRREISEPEDPLIADILHNLALTHERQAGCRERRPGGMLVHKSNRRVRCEHHSRARSLYWEALNIRMAVLGKSHMDTAATMFNLGLSLRNTVMFGRALWMRPLLRQKPLLLSRSLLNATLVSWREYLRNGRNRKGPTGSESTSQRQSKDTSIDIEDVSACLKYLATVELELENFEGAHELFEQQVQVFKECFDFKGKFTLAQKAGEDVTDKIGLHGEALAGQALCMVRLGNLPQAVELYKNARKVLRSCFVVRRNHQSKEFSSSVTAKLVAMRIKSKARTAVRKSQRRNNSYASSQKEVTRARDRDELSIDPHIMTLLKSVEHAVHATAARHNQLLDEGKEEDLKQKDGVRAHGEAKRTQQRSRK